ncbi:hypothetical protein BGZ98_005899 [Dissophora globulifera]|nr:hypothetical protein BGZ98_005899 [Dissophora globulifera]
MLADFSIQVAGWSIAALLQTEKFYDLIGSASFIVCTYLSLNKPWAKDEEGLERPLHPRQVLASGTTVIWACYLGSFLFIRALQYGDRRFDKVKKMPAKLLIYWIVQGIWVAVTALPVYLTNSIPADMHPPIGARDVIGYIFWATGFTFQVLANYQKQQWRKEVGKDYKRSFISHGLWSLSRHPNYFGECVLWLGSYLFSSSAFPDAVTGQVFPHWMSRLAVFSPIFVTFLIIRVSGIPLLERENDRRLKDVVAYWKYKKETSMFVPTWPRSVE